ncbi:MAG: hypothetical protein C4297_13690 [Gemmataceae bacterium]
MQVGLWIVALGLAWQAPEGRWIHPLCQPLPVNGHGPFVELADGRLATVDSKGFRVSNDDGRTWSEPIPICPGINDKEPASYHLVRTRSGALVLVYLDFSNYKFSWDAARKEPKEDCRLEIWAIRSLNEGKTWADRQRLLGGYNANFFGFIQTSQGRLVASVEHLVSDPGRWVVCSLYSDDEGKTWKRSNWIDLGGHGHHDGATEPTVAELSDGRLLMLMRTNLGRFWQAWSEDAGNSWRTVLPSTLSASSAPGHLLRLRSGRLALAWNRADPEGRSYPRIHLPQHSQAAASWHREELSLTLSQDDGRTWTKPLVIARQPGGQLSYPYLFERQPGEIWIFAGFAYQSGGKPGLPGWRSPLPFRVRVLESELLRTVREQPNGGR